MRKIKTILSIWEQIHKKVYIIVRVFYLIGSGFTFICPKKSPILLYDYEGNKILIESTVKDYNYTELSTRGEFFYFSPQILFLMAKNFRSQNLLNLIYIDQYFIRVYFLSCVEYINPKIVITTIDNDPNFYWLSKRYDKAIFFAIQNGVRNKFDLYTSLLDSNGNISKISLPTFICFGQNDVDNFKKLGHEIESPICLGSLRGGYYKYELNKLSGTIYYDLCLVSQYSIDIEKDLLGKNFLAAFEILLDLLKEYIQKNKKTLCIALRSLSNDGYEYNYYTKKFGNDVTIIRRQNNDLFTTYNAMDQSEVILTINSTAAFEAFGWGKKILSCNFLNDEISDFYINGICHLNDSSFIVFEERLNYLLHLSQSEFLELTQFQRKYMMNYNPDLPVHIYIKKIINNLIDN